MGKESHSRKRPILVWIISIFYFISAVWTLFSFYLVYSGSVPLDETQKVYFESLTTFDILITVTAVLVNLVGIILFFMLNRYALYCFITSFTLSMLLTVFQTYYRNWGDLMSGPGLVGAAIGWAINIAIILYAYRLTKKEILQ